MITIQNINKLQGKKLYDIKHERVWRITNVDKVLEVYSLAIYNTPKYIIYVEAMVTYKNSIYAPHTKQFQFELHTKKMENEKGYRLYDKLSPYMIVSKNELSTMNKFIKVLENRIETII
jgi:hypothetical protein